jgi:Tfp pilus assembly protein PilF
MAENPVPARAHEAMGIDYLEQADYANALKEFSAATAGDPSLFLSFFYKGALVGYGKSGADIPASAEADLRRAIELNPRYAPASMALARVIIRRGGSPGDAVPFARQAVESEYTVARYHIAYANILLQAGDTAKAEAEASLPLEDTLPASEEEDARAVLLQAQKCQSSPPCQALGSDVSVTSVAARPAPTQVNEAAAFGSAAATAPGVPHSSMRGIVRSITCDPEGRVLTLEVGEKTITFTMTKKAGISQPETFWLSPSFVDVCKNFVGEPGEVFFKSGQPDTASMEASSLQIIDHF